jgi:hypothetical protein
MQHGPALHDCLEGCFPLLGGAHMILTLGALVNIQKATWKMAIEIVDLPMNSTVIFHSFL